MHLTAKSVRQLVFALALLASGALLARVLTPPSSAPHGSLYAMVDDGPRLCGGSC